LNLFFEVQGQQHQEFNKHFHGDREGFVKSKARDNLKKEWIEKYDHHLIEIYPGDKLSHNALLNKIYKELGFKTLLPTSSHYPLADAHPRGKDIFREGTFHLSRTAQHPPQYGAG